MNTQPEALRLADAIDPNGTCLNNWRDLQDAAAELRRLHEELERCKQVCAATSEAWREDAEEWKVQRNALLEALKYHQEQTRPIQKSIDVIATVEGKKT